MRFELPSPPVSSPHQAPAGISSTSTRRSSAGSSADGEGHASSLHKKHALDLKGAGRDRSAADYAAFESERAAAQQALVSRPLSAGAAVRVVCGLTPHGQPTPPGPPAARRLALRYQPTGILTASGPQRYPLRRYPVLARRELRPLD